MDFNTGIAAVAGFEFAFMSGFCTSAARLGAPDTGLMSYYEMVEQVNPWQSTA
jgi:2-methylisocitrate lyase-like PEP mutase family enzyme